MTPPPRSEQAGSGRRLDRPGPDRSAPERPEPERAGAARSPGRVESARSRERAEPVGRRERAESGRPLDQAELDGGGRVAVDSWEALFRAQVTLLRRLAADDVWDPISMREYDVLFTLGRRPGARARLHELNQESLLSQPSLSRLVERMVVAGYLTREPDPTDRRGTIVAVTEEGTRIQRRIGARHAARIRRYVGGALSDTELLTLQRLCDKLRSAQDEIVQGSAAQGPVTQAPVTRAPVTSGPVRQGVRPVS